MLLTAENLAVRRGEDLIFMNVSFKLSSGQAMLLTGPNGSGKSTLLRVIAGLLRPEEGHVTLAGEGLETDVRASEASHYLGHRNAMKQDLSVFENLNFWKKFLGDFDGGSSLGIEEAAEAVGLASITHLPFGYLSAGQQRRFAMAKLLVAWRPIWILDEPTAALDASADLMFTGLVKTHLEKGGMAVAATHQPLGLENAQELRMTGFAGVEEAW
ncbi:MULTISPECIES: heme ABC exporter ATP-binding protein CcmA [unclassified Rhizobium]|uniref:heme ABC exporter ATP-binding protein CcmA n=1 Tax=unclassified Rhizobium TaxID=2613769 RepID=UPI001784CCA1|nr:MULTISPECIES: heme ABC exporter ATP-binding protein CcmA [unclassified Rhizobium]MBD8687952.1 heme ABC exporter ATP-binding protein CcmA [Rhizobium sp. CFBP 13644]MBD8692407.1 heme ABC exporter ATP-binding protein CcmA [Rhizobium sp. CFBP 13717]